MPTTNETVVDGMPFTDAASATVAHIKQGGPSDLVDFGEVVVYEIIPAPNKITVSHAVAVASTIGGEAWRLDQDAPVVAEVIAFNLSSARAIVDALTIRDYVSYFVASSTWVNPYVSIPTNATSLKLISTTAGTVTLRKPDFGDSDSYEPYRVSRLSRGGDLQVFQDPMWPTTEVLSFKFSYLDPTVAESLLVFLKATAGQVITLKDHFGRTWTGFIITPAGDVVQEKRTTKTAAFKFQVAP